jgi:hypothetical protein
LIPQKTTRRPGARTSGTALLGGGFSGRFGVALVDAHLEQLAQQLAAQRREPRLPRLEATTRTLSSRSP